MPFGNRHNRPETQRAASSTPHYQSFGIKPPSSRGKPPTNGTSSKTMGRKRSHSQRSGGSNTSNKSMSPLPTKQLVVLAIIALAEQTAFNSISPYLPEMTGSFPDVPDASEIGLYVGLIASAFASAQFVTNFFWGWLSDKIGRKPVILLGTILTAACFLAFGFCKTLWQAILVQIMMGLVNGNQGVVSTCLGEITDRTNQSKAFTYLPVVYGIGAVTGPIVGGLLVHKKDVKPLGTEDEVKYPYLAPNLLSAAVLLFDLVVTMIFMEESLEEAKCLPPLGKRVGSMFARIWQFQSPARNPSYIRQGSSESVLSVSEAEEEVESDASTSNDAPTLLPDTGGTNNLRARDVLNRDTSLILATYFVFQLSNIAYNSLYPIFAQAAPPTGRNLSPQEIGISLAFAGLVTILFQLGIFGRLRDKIGNKIMYRVGLAGFVVSFLLMPFVGYKSEKDDPGDGGVISTGKAALWAELGIVLIIKTLASVGGLTSALLLITNSAPDHSVLGALNGLAQTLSALGRAIGPFVSGSLFTAATQVKNKGEAIAFGIFGGVAFVGFIMSFWIKGRGLEAEGKKSDEGEGDEETGDSYDEEEEGSGDAGESTPLVGGKGR